MENRNYIFTKVCVFSSVFFIFLIHASHSQKTFGSYRSTTTAISSFPGNKKPSDLQNAIEDRDDQNNKNSKTISEKNKGRNKTSITTESPLSLNKNKNKGDKSGSKNGTSMNLNNDLNNYTITTTEGYGDFDHNSTESSSRGNSTTSEKSIRMIGVIGKKEFHYSDQNMRFGGAIEFCLSHNMTLAAIESEFENNLVKNFFDSVENHKHGWLGATDGFSRKGEFLWMKNRDAITYFNWADSFPKSEEKTSCINFNGGEWKNWSCDYYGTENSAAYIRPICEKES